MAPPAKRFKTDQPAANFYIHEDNSADIEMKDLSLTKIIETSGSEVNFSSLFNSLQEIEKSNKSDYMLSIDVAKVCSQFSAQSALSFLKSGQFKKLAALISKILIEQADDLDPEQLTGLFIAGFTLQGQCWTNAVAMLKERS